MGREFASACARWIHLEPIGARPRIVSVCDPNPQVLDWYERLDPRPRLLPDYRQVLAETLHQRMRFDEPGQLFEGMAYRPLNLFS